LDNLLERLKAALAERYEIERELGRGGMATVYLARDLKHPRKVAIKVLTPELAAVVGAERFLHEIETTASLTHPHILPLLDSGEADGLLYYVMPFIAGQSLRDRLTREEQLPIEDALRIIRDVASALDYAHRQGILHRDIKPENILLSEGEAVVADFGIARAIHVAGGKALTQTGIVVGTPAYMSPEHASGSGTLDGRSDLYSLGCVLYEMLAGETPFTGLTAQAILSKRLTEPVPRLGAVRETVPEAVEHAVTKALSKVPADRYPTPARFAEALGVQLETPPRGVVKRKSSRRSWAIAVGAGALVAIAAVVVWLAQSRDGGGGTSVAAGVPRPWIWVAEFEGPSSDPTSALVARDMVAAALDQSGIVATVPRGQVREALRLAGKSDTVRVDAELARELAFRSGVSTVVSGQVRRIGPSYSLVVRLVEAKRDSTLVTLTGTARDEGRFIETVSGLSRELTDELAERGDVVGTTSRLFKAATPNFLAYQKYARVREMMSGSETHWRDIIVLSREATRLDSDFTSAWRQLGRAYDNLGMVDSARVAFEEALRRPERLTDEGRISVQASLAWNAGRLEDALDLYERFLRRKPNNISGWNSRGNLLTSLGRLEEGLASVERAIELAPVRAPGLIVHNQVVFLLALGRLDEASKVVEAGLEGSYWRRDGIQVALWREDWPSVRHDAPALIDDSSAQSRSRFIAHLALASAVAAQGRFDAAERVLEDARRYAEQVDNPAWGQSVVQVRLLLTDVSGRPTPAALEPARSHGSAGELVTSALTSAARGDADAARTAMARFLELPDHQRGGWFAAQPIVEARIAVAEGRWADVVRGASPLALSDRSNAVGFFAARSMAVWLCARAYESLGRADSAIVLYEKAATLRGMIANEGVAAACGISLAHQRLVMLYLASGELEKARAHWEKFEASFTNPDPDLVHLREEARAALASVAALAPSER
jgi:serine/threonine-protein kinase